MLNTVALAERHTFMVLTKRPETMLSFFESDEVARLATVLKGIWESSGKVWHWPLPNLWLGSSVENQETADARVDLLLRTPAAVRFVSCEPLLEAVEILPKHCTCACGCETVGLLDRKLWFCASCFINWCQAGDFINWCHGEKCAPRKLDWVIAGGESGPGEMPDELGARLEARAAPAAIEWFRSLRDQCRAAGVPFFMKQLGSRPMFELGDNKPWHASGMMLGDGHGGSFRRDARLGLRQGFAVHTRDRKGADMSEWPEDLRIREWPVS